MKVAVEILTGSLFYVNVEDDINATVVDLKRAIAAQLKLPFERLILLHGDGRDQEDGATDESAPLAEYGVHDGSHIYLFFKPLDDGSSHSFLFTWPEAFF